MKIKFENVGGIKEGIYEVKVTAIKRVKVGQDKKPATQVKFVGKEVTREHNFFDNYFGGQLFSALVQATIDPEYDVETDVIDSKQLIGELCRIELKKQKNDPRFLEIVDILPYDDDIEEDDDDIEEDDDDIEEDEDEEEEEDEDDEE